MRDGQSTVTRLDRPYLGDWAIFRVDHDALSEEVQHFVAGSQERALFLRGGPEAFAGLLAADEAAIDSADTAVRVLATSCTSPAPRTFTPT